MTLIPDVFLKLRKAKGRARQMAVSEHRSTVNILKGLNNYLLHLSKKQKIFSQFSALCLKFTSIVEHFEKKDDPYS